MSYILSVVIPTKNRLNYLKGCLSSINNLHRNDVEIIIQDNSDNHDEVLAYVLSLNNENIKYYYDGRSLSQTENSDLAFSHITGKYAVYIGDDDSICESIIDLAYSMSKYSIDSATYGISTFNWPDLIEAVPNAFSFKYYSNIVPKIELQDSNLLLVNALKNGMQDITKLPRVYHGIVSKDLLYSIYQYTGGSFFPGPSPDMANATACSLLTRRHISINKPMIISGFGKTSAGGMGKRKLHKGSLKGNFQLRDDVEDTWDNKIPKRWMQSAIWPNSAVSALKSLQKSEYVKYLNYGIIASETILHDRTSFKSVFCCKLSILEWFVCFIHTIKRVFSRFIIKKKKQEGEIVLFEPISIEKAVEIQNLENKKIDLDSIFLELFQS